MTFFYILFLFKDFEVSFCSFSTLICSVAIWEMFSTITFFPRNDTCFWCAATVNSSYKTMKLAPHLELVAPFSSGEQSNPSNRLQWCKADWNDTAFKEFKGISLQHLCHAHNVLDSIQPEPGASASCTSMASALNVPAKMLDQEPILFSKKGVNSWVHSHFSETESRQRRKVIYKVDVARGLSLLNPVLLAHIM